MELLPDIHQFFQIDADNYTEVREMIEQLDKITSIETQNINWKNTNPEAITIDELTGEIIEIHNDAMATSKE